MNFVMKNKKEAINLVLISESVPFATTMGKLTIVHEMFLQKVGPIYEQWQKEKTNTNNDKQHLSTEREILSQKAKGLGM